ncbi:hypothetical protein AB0D65_02950 [Streptomyces griseoloalbus]|uniref:SMP-30/Gluconolactonase/LRE-like region domain-containing protein n=1 Tax=Streptomyces griseoloalbus TaxID=67303 RepID=A0ABV3DYK8_9ACTN
MKQISGAAGARGVALSGDSGTLYVALRDAGAIAAVDTVTLRETARYDTGTGTGAGTYAGPPPLAGPPPPHSGRRKARSSARTRAASPDRVPSGDADR